jgi:KDO2-lipid IV(A) lauroyltransferase
MAQLFLGTRFRGAATAWPWLQSCLWRLESGILGAFWWWCSWLSPDQAVACGQGLLSRIGPHLAKHRQIKANLRVAFPEKDAAQLEVLARGVWGNLGAVLAEYPHLDAIIDAPTGQRLEVILKTDLTPYAGGKKAAIFVNAHLGNWELPPALGKIWNIPLAVLYTPMRNPWLERRLQRQRQRLGCELLVAAQSMKPTVQRLTHGISMGFLVDQRVDSGEWIPFFGREALTTSSPARLALKFDCPLIPLQVERLQGAHFRLTIHPPLTPEDPQADPVTQARQMTRQLNALFEDWIRQHPQQWLCTKRRWPQED